MADGDIECEYADFVSNVDHAMDELMAMLNTMGLAASEPTGPTPTEDMTQALVVDSVLATGDNFDIQDSGDDADDELSGQYGLSRKRLRSP